MKLTIIARFHSHQSSESFVPSRMQTRTRYPSCAMALRILCALYSRSPPQYVSWIFVPSMHIFSSRKGFSLSLFGKIMAGFRLHQSSESFVPSHMQAQTRYPPQDLSRIFFPSMHISSLRQGFSLAPLFEKNVAGF